MERIMNKILMVVSACMVMVLGSLSPASAAYYVNQMTNNAFDDMTGRLSKNGDMVWVGVGDLSSDIFVYDGKTRVISQLMNDGVEDNSPQINDNGDIVWMKLNLAEAVYNIMLYTKATGEIKRISLPANPNPALLRFDSNPKLNNFRQIVYESQDDGFYSEIMFYDGTSVIPITSNTLTDEFPLINDYGDIVWMQSVGDTGISDIMLRKGTDGSVINLTNSASANELNPRINNVGDIVWSAWDGVYFQIWYYKKSTGLPTKVTSTSYDNMNPRINAIGHFVWTQESGTDGEVFLRSGLTGTTTNVSNSPTKDDNFPDLNDNGWVAWSQDQGTANTNGQVFVWDKITATRLVTDTYNHTDVAINNSNTIAWNGTGGAGTILTDLEMFIATTGNCSGVNCNDNNACTFDWCNPATGNCMHDLIVCNDNNACTQDGCNTITGCYYTPMVCNDNNLCTLDSCDAAIGCIFTPFVCNDSNLCTTDTCSPASGCIYTPLPAINDNNACTTDYCNPAIGASSITHTTLVCNDNSVCTTDSCNTATGCVFTPLPGIDDGKLCTIDTCNPTTGVITHTAKVCDDKQSCTTDTCDTATGNCVNTTTCTVTTNNQFTMLDSGGNVAGGTNDVLWAWDGVKKTSVAASGQISNSILYSTCSFGGVSWSAHDVAVYGPGTYTVYAACPAGSPGCGSGTPITFTVKTGEIGVHMLFNWNNNNDIDVVNILKPNAVFGPSRMWMGACGSNADCNQWTWMSYDWDLDGINGGRMVDGPFVGFSPNFSFIKTLANVCCDVATRCDDHDACTTETCNTATGACGHTPVVCNDNNLCTTDTCSTATGCVFTPKNCDDNNLCTTDSCNTATGACVNTLKICNDNNACTNDSCKTSTGQCIYTAIFCADGNPCTTDTCNTATGCVFTPKDCSDNNLCTTDSCDTATGACTYAPITCPGSHACNPASGCISSVNTTGNNFTMLATNGYGMGGTNDVKFTWDGTYQNATTFANGTGPSNATISSDEPFNNWLWYAKRVQVIGPGTYWVDLDGTGPGTNRYEVTIPNGQLGVHMLWDWGPTGQATSCGKTDCDVDVWMAWNLIKPFAAGQLFTGPEDGTTTNAPAWDEPYPMPFAVDGRLNASTKVWDMVSVDLAGRITTSAGVTVTNLPLDGVPGIKMREGTTNLNSNININVMWVDLCYDAATRCNDNNACTKDTCDPATGVCGHPAIVCNDDNNACTTDTCNTATGCVFTPKNCNDNNACTLDFCSPLSGICYHSTIVCNDNKICTTDTCNTATGCVYTNNTAACSDNNACTQNDVCSAGVCVAGTTVTCPVGVCNTASGCTYTSVSTTGNNLTMLMANGIVLGGTNDVKFIWDGTVQNVTTFANGSGPSNATITSDEPLNSWRWYAKRVQVVGPGTYWVDLDGTGPSTNRYEVTIPANRIGAHLLLDWGDTGQPTTCGKLNCDVDVWMAWDFNNAFMTGKLFTGADNGTLSNGPASDDPYPLPFVIDGKPNTLTTVWGLVSVDLPGRIITSTGGTLKDLPLNVIPGVPIKEGTYDGVSASFNMKLQ